MVNWAEALEGASDMKKMMMGVVMAAMAMPLSVQAGALEAGKTYICTAEAISARTSVCGRVEARTPATDLCVRVLADNRLAVTPVKYGSGGNAVCSYPATVVAGSGTTTATGAGLGGLGSGGAIAGVFLAAGLAAAMSGGSSNGTNDD